MRVVLRRRASIYVRPHSLGPTTEGTRHPHSSIVKAPSSPKVKEEASDISYVWLGELPEPYERERLISLSYLTYSNKELLKILPLKVLSPDRKWGCDLETQR